MVFSTPEKTNRSRSTLHTILLIFLQQQLETIAQTDGSIAAFIHLHPSFDRQIDLQLQHESAMALLKHVFA